MVAVPVRLGISARGNSPAPGASLSRFFGSALKAETKKDDPPAPPKSQHVFNGQSRVEFSLDQNSPYYDENFARLASKYFEKGYERADESELNTAFGILLWKVEGFNPFPGERPRRVGATLDLSSLETRGLGEHPLKSRFDDMRKSLLDETQGLVTALLTTGQAQDGNYYTPFYIEAATYYAQNNIVTDADPFRDETDDPGKGKSNTYAMNNISSLDEGRQLIVQALSLDPRPLTDIVIATHGDDGKMYFVDADGVGTLVRIENLDDFLGNLHDMGVLKPGAQLHLTGCSIAASRAGQDVLQGLSTKYGLRIIANRTVSTWRRTRVSNAMVFYPGTDTEHDLVQKYYDYKNAAANSP